jgi:hypothetical protein
MRMRQSLNQLERAFVEQIEAEEDKAERVQRDVELRSRKRELDRTHRAGYVRFWALVFVLVATAVLVTLAMFQLLLWVMG